MNNLDAEELFHLGVSASERGDHENAISYLKASIADTPIAQSLYLLAAEYAEIGMHMRAIDLMQQAIEMQPELWIAYFQLGLLFLTVNQHDSAEEVWRALIELDESNYMHHFGKGLIQVLNDELQEGILSLKTGIEMNDEHAALNNDMMDVIENILTENGVSLDEAHTDTDKETTIPLEQDAAPKSDAADARDIGEAGEKDERTARSPQHLFLSNYDKGSAEEGFDP